MVKELEFLNVADLHLEKLGIYFPEQDHLKYTFDALKTVESYAIKNGISLIVQNGDVFESADPEQDSQLRLLDFCRNSKLDYLFDLGNHDFSENNNYSLKLSNYVTSLKAIKNAKFFVKPEITEYEGIPFCFLPWPHYRAIETKYPKIVVAHIGMRGALRDNGTQIGKEEGHKIETGDDFWLIGHLHRHQMYKRIAYPGTLYQLNFGEPLPKGFLHCRVKLRSSKLEVQTRFIPVNPPYEFHNIIVRSSDDLKQIKRKPNTYYKLFIKDKFSLPENYLRDNSDIILRHTGYSTKEELKKLQEDVLLIDELKREKLDVKEYLPAFLKNEGLNKPQIKRAIKIVKKIERKLLNA